MRLLKNQLLPVLALTALWGTATCAAVAMEPAETESKAAGSNASAKIVAPFVDAQTLVVAHLDLNAFEPMKTIDWLTGILGLSPRSRDNIQSQAVPITVITQGQPKGQTVSVFIVVSLADVGRLPFFLVLPVDDHTPSIPIATEVRRELEKAWNRKVASERVGDALIVGSQETIDRLKKGKPVARPEIAAAYNAVGAGGLQIAFVPSADVRRLAEALLPEAPKYLGGGATKIFTQGAVWSAISIDLPPNKIAARLVIQSADAAAASALEKELGTTIDAVALHPNVKTATPEFAEIAKRLTPKAVEDQLKIELSEEKQEITDGIKVLGSLMQAVMNGAAK